MVHQQKRRQPKNRGPGLDSNQPGGSTQGVKCGVTRKGKVCALPAGWGTPNRSGPCKHHGGAMPNVLEKYRAVDSEREAERELKRLGLFGEMRADVTPRQALAEELGRTYARVEALGERLQELERSERIDTLAFRGAFEQWVQERGQLQRVAEAATRCGVEERQIEVSNEIGMRIATLLTNLLKDLQLTERQKVASKALARWHLTAMAGGDPGERPPLPSRVPDSELLDFEGMRRDFEASQSGSRRQLQLVAADRPRGQRAGTRAPAAPVPDDEPTVARVRAAVTERR